MGSVEMLPVLRLLFLAPEQGVLERPVGRRTAEPGARHHAKELGIADRLTLRLALDHKLRALAGHVLIANESPGTSLLLPEKISIRRVVYSAMS